MDDAAKVIGKACKDTKKVTSGSGPSNKRKRSVLTKENLAVMTSMTEVIRDVASAIHDTTID